MEQNRFCQEIGLLNCLPPTYLFMNPSSNLFDPALKEISHYQSFPAMLPFVGQGYVLENRPKLLILGESFYLPEYSTLQLNAGEWYSSNQGLLDDEVVAWINCRGLLECDWKSGGQRMYAEINRCLAEVDLPSLDRPVSNICYNNTFMRPATEGESFKHCCEEQDIVVSIDTLTRVIATLKPDLVIFVSKYAWDAVGWRIAKQIASVNFDFVSHPLDPRHWNVKSYEHGREKFISLLKKWARKAGCD